MRALEGMECPADVLKYLKVQFNWWELDSVPCVFLSHAAKCTKVKCGIRVSLTKACKNHKQLVVINRTQFDEVSSYGTIVETRHVLNEHNEDRVEYAGI